MGYEKIESYDKNSGLIKSQRCTSHKLGGQIYLVNSAFINDHIDGKIYTFLNSTSASEVRKPERKSALHRLLVAELQKSLAGKV